MVNAAEKPFAITPTGDGELMQRIEVRSHRRNDLPVKRGKSHDNVTNLGQKQVGDSNHKKVGTQKCLQVHSAIVRNSLFNILQTMFM